MHDDGQRIHLLAIEQDVDLHHVRRTVLQELIVHGGIAARDRLELVKKVQHDFAQRHFIGQHDLTAVVLHVHLDATLLIGQRHHGAHVVLRHVQVHGHDGLQNFLDASHIRHLRGAFHIDDFTVTLDHLVDHAGRGGDQVLVELTLQTLLHDFHVQQAQKAAAEAKAQRLRDFWLKLQGRIIELQLFQCVAQLVVFRSFCGVQAGKHLGLDFLEAWQRCLSRAQIVGQLLFQRDGVAHLGGLQFLDAGNDVTHFTRLERVTRRVRWGEHAHLVGFIGGARSHHLEALVLLELTVNHAHQHHNAHIGVKPAVHDHGAQRRIRVALGRGHLGDDGLQDVINAHAGLGRAGNGIAGINADHVFDLGLGVIRISLGQVHLVQHGKHFHAQVQRGVAVGHGLRFHALRSIHHQQAAFTGRQRARHFIREVHVTGSVDQVQVVDIAVLGLVLQSGGLCLDGDAALFLDIHRVKHLRLHFTLCQATTALDQAVGKCRFAVVNVRNDGKISDVLHQR